MHVLTLTCPEGEVEILVAELYARGTTGIEEHPAGRGSVELRACFRERFPADEFARYGPAWSPADPTNWARKIMQEWEPTLVGERFFIVPDWRHDPTPPGRIRLEVHPGLALGTGYHPTTQMCLESMERKLRRGDRFLDLGCGAGILSHAAHVLGAARILAVDVDPQAIESARENLARSGVPALLVLGSADCLAPGWVDFLAANISGEIFIRLAPTITSLMAPAGRAVLSGFPPDFFPQLERTFAARQWRVVSVNQREGWAAVTLERAPA